MTPTTIFIIEKVV